jgi:hypothetical protein
MNERKEPGPSAEALLAQQTWPADAELADYRRRLDEALEAAARGPRQLRLFAWPSRQAHVALAILVAACVLVAVVLNQRWPEEAGPEQSAAVVVLRWEGAQSPFPEETADVVAVATVGEVLSEGRQKVLGLKVGRLLKGTFAPKAVVSGETIPSFACCLSCSQASLPDYCHAGTKVVVFVQGSPAAGWKLLNMRELPAEREDRLVHELERNLQLERNLRQHGKKLHLAW